ncbi:MAG: hypothetical protein ACRD04_05205 [Terriglobales bacterium]
MKSTRWVLLVAVCISLAGFSWGQSVDAYLGLGTLITGPSPLASEGVPKLGGGAYLNAGGDIIFLPHNLGLGAQVQWRASQADYFGLGARPVLYSFNLMWEPVPVGVSVRPDFAIGVGADNFRVYQGVETCGTFTGCTDHQSENHFLFHVGVGLKVYWGQHLFLRPAVDYYDIHDNYVFGSAGTGAPEPPSAWQAGISIGYTLGPSQ